MRTTRFSFCPCNTYSNNIKRSYRKLRDRWLYWRWMRGWKGCIMKDSLFPCSKKSQFTHDFLFMICIDVMSRWYSWWCNDVYGFMTEIFVIFCIIYNSIFYSYCWEKRWDSLPYFCISIYKDHFFDKKDKTDYNESKFIIFGSLMQIVLFFLSRRFILWCLFSVLLFGSFFLTQHSSAAMTNWSEKATQKACQHINRTESYCLENFEDLNKRLTFYLDDILMELDSKVTNNRYKAYMIQTIIKKILDEIDVVKNSVDTYMYVFVMHYLDIYRIYASNNRDYTLWTARPEVHWALQKSIPDIKYYKQFDVVVLEVSEYIFGDEIIKESNDAIHVLWFQVANNTDENIFLENLVIDIDNSQYLDFSYLDEVKILNQSGTDLWDMQVASIWGRQSFVYIWYPPIIRPWEVQNYDIKIKVRQWFAESPVMYGRFEWKIAIQDLRITSQDYVLDANTIKHLPSTSRRTWIQNESTSYWHDLTLSGTKIIYTTPLSQVETTINNTWSGSVSNVSFGCYDSNNIDIMFTVTIPTVASWSIMSTFPLLSTFGDDISGNKEYTCKIDKTDTIDESNETNNTETFSYKHVTLLSGSTNIWTIWSGVYVRLGTGDFQTLTGADGSTFTGILANNTLTNYFKDASKVYYITQEKSKTLTSLNPTSFTLINNSPSYAKDDTTIVYKWEMLVGANVPSFTLLQHEYAKDTNTVYKGSGVVISANPSSFVALSQYYGKDNITAYYLNNAILSSDPATFTLLNMYYSKDQYAAYYKKDEISNAEAATFILHPTDPTKASDQYRSYTDGIPWS